MDSVIDSVILATALVGSFGAAFLVQKIVLDLIVSAMNRR